ncbi:hypothetical protein D3C72_1255300 [compost metagenome]
MVAADQGRQHADQRNAQAPAHHQRAGEHEEGNGDQREALDLRHHLLNKQIKRDAVRGGGRRHGCHQQRVSNGHCQYGRPNKYKKEKSTHGWFLCAIFVGLPVRFRHGGLFVWSALYRLGLPGVPS